MSEPTVMTAEGLRALRAELAVLESDGRRDIAQRIKTAREWGDLKENAEYHDAKNAQAMLETRIAVLNDQIRTAAVTEPDAGSETVAFGSAVTVRDDATGRETTYTIVSSRDADAAKGLLSVQSPVATALRGRAARDRGRRPGRGRPAAGPRPHLRALLPLRAGGGGERLRPRARHRTRPRGAHAGLPRARQRRRRVGPVRGRAPPRSAEPGRARGSGRHGRDYCLMSTVALTGLGCSGNGEGG